MKRSDLDPAARRSRWLGMSLRGRSLWPAPREFTVDSRRFARLDPRRVSHRFPGALGRRLNEDVEAFLRGGYAEYLEDRSETIPVWVWTNLLAHGTEADVRRASGDMRTAGLTCQWRDARAYLATELLAAVEREHGSLAELQRRALIPLELELAAWPGVTNWSPQHLVTAVLAGLCADQRSRNR